MKLYLEEAYTPEKAAPLGNKFFTGNGYMGVRGTVDEARLPELPAVNIAGLYDGLPGAFRETVNVPNPFYGYLTADDEILSLSQGTHILRLDIKTARLIRESTYATRRGCVKFISERFVSMADAHAAGQRFRISADFHADIRLVAGIDSHVWDINGPHLRNIRLLPGVNTDEDGNTGGKKQTTLTVTAFTSEKNIKTEVSTRLYTDFPCLKSVTEKDGILAESLNFVTNIGQEYTIEKIISVDTGDCIHSAEILSKDFAKLYKSHREEWEKIWENAEVIIEGDRRANLALNFSIYQLYSIAPREGSSLSIPARGLSGQTYKGAVFWDTEIFMMDIFVNTCPRVARDLILYRIESLPGARKKAAEYGYDGAFYAWESQEMGYDACSDYNVTDVFTARPMRTYFKDRQVHISAAVVYAMIRYVNATGDRSVLETGGAEVIKECAEFYRSLLIKRVKGKQYEIRDVIGPDEYHERVNNNGYTNRMARFVFETAAEVLKEYGTGDSDRALRTEFLKLAKQLFIPGPDEDGIIPQFDGYRRMEDTVPGELRKRLLNEKEYWGGAYGVASQTQVIKQADVMAWLALFPGDFPRDVIQRNWEYYEPRTEHGSSLSSCMYGLTACLCGKTDAAYEMFMKSAEADLVPSQKEWAGLIYIGGIHPAAHGGAYMLAVRGFAGMKREKGKLKFAPALPGRWKSMTFTCMSENKKYRVTVKKDGVTLKKIG